MAFYDAARLGIERQAGLRYVSRMAAAAKGEPGGTSEAAQLERELADLNAAARASTSDALLARLITKLGA